MPQKIRQIFAMPRAGLRERFSAIIGPHFGQADRLTAAVGQRETLRGLLLLRVISGSRAGNPDIRFPSSMQDVAG